MAYEYRKTRRVEFADTDSAGIVHFANFLRYMEETEHEFLRSLGLTVHPLPGQVLPGKAASAGQIGFPRLATRCEFHRPLRFEDEVEIHLRVARKGRSAITYQYVFQLEGDPAAIGEIVVLCCRLKPGVGMEKVDLPQAYDSALEEAPYERLEFRSADG